MYPRRSRRLGVAAAAAVSGLALALLPAASASAATAPDWPTSRVPSGCDSTAVGADPSGFTVSFTDTQAPRVTGWTYNGSKTRAVLPPGTFATSFKVTASQTCSGVGAVTVFGRQSINGGAPSVSPVSLDRLTSNAFNATFGFENPTATSSITGWLEIPFIVATPRYDSFALDADFGLLSKVDYTGATPYLTGPWSTQRLYLVLATTQATAASKTTVAKGGTVTFATTVKKATPAGYAALSGVSVKLQTKLPGQAWITRATRTTSATGRAAYSFKPAATMAWRWVLAENITTAPYTAASTSTVKTIKVT